MTTDRHRFSQALLRDRDLNQHIASLQQSRMSAVRTLVRVLGKHGTVTQRSCKFGCLACPHIKWSTREPLPEDSKDRYSALRRIVTVEGAKRLTALDRLITTTTAELERLQRLVDDTTVLLRHAKRWFPTSVLTAADTAWHKTCPLPFSALAIIALYADAEADIIVNMDATYQWSRNYKDTGLIRRTRLGVCRRHNTYAPDSLAVKLAILPVDIKRSPQPRWSSSYPTVTRTGKVNYATLKRFHLMDHAGFYQELIDVVAAYTILQQSLAKDLAYIAKFSSFANNKTDAPRSTKKRATRKKLTPQNQ
jgi:hypothetical protein